MSVQQRRKYDADFKRNAVLLSEEPGRTVAEIADNLGIARDLLYRWRKEYRVRARYSFPGNGREALAPKSKKYESLKEGSEMPRWNGIY